MLQGTKRALSGLIFLCVVGNAQSSNPAAQFSVGGKPPIQIFASISARDGSVAAPAPSTLNAAIDKQPAQVLSLRPAKDDKLLFAVIVDISSSEAPKEQSIKDAAIRIFQGLSNGGSQGYLVLVNQLLLPSKRPLQPSEAQAVLSGIKFNGGTALFDGIGQTCTQILGRSQNPDMPRRILVLLSDGEDNYSHLLFSKAEDDAQREGIAIYSLAEFSNPSPGEAILKQASKDTGGREIFVNKLSEGISPLLTDIEGQSVLSIVPSQAADQKLHSLVVKATEKDISVSVPTRILLP